MRNSKGIAVTKAELARGCVNGKLGELWKLELLCVGGISLGRIRTLDKRKMSEI